MQHTGITGAPRAASNPCPMILGLSRAAAVGLGVLLAGCAQHGAYTTKFKQDATARMDKVKAGTMWDTANQQYQAGDLDKALETINGSLALSDQVAKSHVLKGRILFEQGRPDAALESLNKAIELDPKQTEAFYFRGVVQERQERYEPALQSYQAAAELDKSNPQYAVASAEMMIHLGRLEEAVGLLEVPADSDRPRFNQNAGARQTLGHIAMIRGDHAEAVRYFKEACTLAPGDNSLLEDLARAQVASSRFGEAESNLSKVLASLKPDERRDLRLLRARCLVEIERPVDARTVLQELVSAPGGASDPEAWVQLGNVALIVKDSYRLREAANRVIALAPSRPEGYLLLGLYQHQAGKTSDALELLEKSVARTTDDPTPAIVLGLLYQQAGQVDRARAAASKALEISPSNQRARELAEQLSAVATASEPAQP